MVLQANGVRRLALLCMVLVVGCTGQKSEAPAPEALTARPPRAPVLATEEACQSEPIPPRATQLIYQGATAVEYGDAVPLVARLTDDSGQPLSARQVRFLLDTEEVSATTDELGIARVSVLPTQAPGELSLQVHYAGDATTLASSTTATITLMKADTAVRVLGPSLLATGTPQPVRASLADADDQRPIVGRTLVFEAGGARATALTDSSGIATAVLSWSTNATGPSVLKVSFAGDAYYLPSADELPITRYLPTAFAIWGGNTPAPRLGERVNFWGHSWAKQVTGGAYDAQADFKGWAPGLAAFALCQPSARPGGNPALTQECWNSKTGQSFPPASLPEYIGVLVPDAIAKTKGVVFGNVAALAVLKVDPNPPYGPVPGKPGWGTLVAIADGGNVFPQPAVLVASQRQPLTVAPGETFEVAMDIGNPTQTPAESVVVTEQFEGTTPATGEQVVGTIAPLAQRTVTFSQKVAGVEPRRAGESVADYQTRLAALDNRVLHSLGHVRFMDPAGTTPPVINVVSFSRLTLPRLTATLAAPSCAAPCTTIPYVVTVANIGAGKAASVTATLTLPDGTQQVLELGGLGSNALATRTVEWAVPGLNPRGEHETIDSYLARLQEAAQKGYAASVQVVWKDGKGNAYGSVDRQVTTGVRLPILAVSAEHPTSVLPSQTFPLRFTVSNLGNARAEDARLQMEGGASVPTFSLESGQSTTFTVDVVAPAVPPKGAEEPDAAYQARLEAVDGSLVSYGYGLDWGSACESRFGPLPGTVKTFMVLPVVTVGLEGPTSADAGETLQYTVTLANVGHGDASGLVLEVVLPDGSTQTLAVPGGMLARNTSVRVPFTFDLPAQRQPGPVTARTSIRWMDAVANAYGPQSAAAITQVRRSNQPPVVDAGPSLMVTHPSGTTLLGSITDDGLPAGAALTSTWVQVSGPGMAVFADASQQTTGVTFTEPGTYVLRLIGSDGEFSASDETTVTVKPREGSGTTVPGDSSVPGEVLINVVRDGNQIRLDNTTRAFNFIWVAVSSKGTVVKLDTETGKVLGEYWTSPTGQPKNPSRTTVDKNGNVWATNRDGNSVVHIGLAENGQCVDRNGNGVIDTSKGYGDIKGWANTGGADTNGGVTTAQDECLLHYVRVKAYGTRHVSVDENNDVWVSGYGSSYSGFFDLIDGRTGTIKRRENAVGYGGYGGLIDHNGVIWSAGVMLRWDTALPLNGANGINWRGYSHASYGLCLAPDGSVWNSEYGSYIRRFSPTGELLGTYYHGFSAAQGCVVDAKGHIWVAHSLNGSSVGHLLPNGTWLGNIAVGSGPTGVAVDGSGKVWATNHYSQTVMRIDPAKGPVGSDKVTPVGAVDLTSGNLGGLLYNYSDMTGSTLAGAPDNGTWTVVYDSNTAGSEWGKVVWTGQACGDGSLTVTAASSNDGVTYGAPVVVRSGVDLDVPNGRYLKVSVAFKRSSKGESPVLYNLSIGTAQYVMPEQANDAPSVDAGRDRTMTSPHPLRLMGSACDDGLPMGGTLGLAWTRVSGPGTVTFSAPDAEATDVSFSVPGIYVLRLTATDSALGGHDDVTITVLPNNEQPSVSAVAPGSVDLPEPANLSGSVSDDGLPSGSAVTVTWSKVSGPGTVTFVDPNALATSASFSAAGTYVLRLTASDSHLTTSADVTVVANPEPPVNQAPIVSAGANQSVALGATVTLRGSVTDDGLPVGKTVSVTWTKVTGPGTVGFGNASSATTTASFSAAGVYVLRLTATDSALSSSSDVSVAVGQPAPVNQPPQVVAGANQAITLPGTATLAGSVQDDGLPEGGTLAAQWTKVSGPGTVTFNPPGQPATVASFSAAGTYVLRLTASDGQFASTSDLSVTVSASVPSNKAPVVNAGPSWNLRLPTRTVTLTGSVQDDGLPTGAAVTQQWSMVEGPASVAFGTPTQPTTTVTVSKAGMYRLRLTASDTKLTGSSDLTLNVAEASPDNAPPDVDVGLNLTVSLPAPAVTLQGSVTDDGRPVGNTLEVHWEQVSGPAPMTFADATKAATTAAFTVPGDYMLRLVASDGEWVASAVMSVKVQPNVVNKPPTVSATGPATVTLPGAAQLSGAVRDDGQPASGALVVAWTKLSGPGTVSFTRPAQVSTAASFSAPGDYVLRLTANDSALTASADVAVRALVVNGAPTVFAGDNQMLEFPARTLTLAGTVTDDGLPAGGTLTMRWSLVAGAGTVSFGSPDQAVTTATFSYPGSYLLRLTASDSDKLSSSEMVVNVGSPPGPLPVVTLTGPVDGTTVSQPVAVTGTVSEGVWKLEYQLGNGEDPTQPWTVFASGTAPASGTLATFDPTVLLNGTYTVRLVASTSAGDSVATLSAVSDKNLKLGAFSLSFEDLMVPMSGVSMELTRTYDSRDKRVGDFGVGWNLGLRNVRVEKSGILGKGWQQTKSGGLFPNYCLTPARPAFVTITFPSGKVYKFQASTSPRCQQLFPIQTGDMSFEPAEETKSSLVPLGGGDFFVNHLSGIPGPVTLSDLELQPINPSSFQLTTEDGTRYQLDEKRGVQAITDPNGNTLHVTPAGLIHSSGRSVLFDRDSLGRITRVTDPNGNTMTYTYDARGDLREFKDREGNVAKFAYDGTHYLTAITDPRGIQPARNEYDEQGRIVRHTDAFGRSVEYARTVGTRQEILTDRLGRARVLEYDGSGNVVRETDPEGRVTTRTFDSRGNKTSETNALGETRHWEYDAYDNKLSETDPKGQTERWTYNTRGQVLTYTDATGRVARSEYDASGNPTAVTDALGNVTRATYNASGDTLSETDALGNVTRYAYDASGRVLKETDALGRESSYTYDANGNRLTETRTRVTATGVETLTTHHEYDKQGRRTKTTHPDGTSTRTEYNSLGLRSATVDELGRTTRYTYDLAGKLHLTTFPDGTTEEVGHDAEGRRDRVTDRAGRTTRYEYDAVGRLARTVFPDGTAVATTYDASGRPITHTDELGHVTRTGYDDAGRTTSVTDAAGQVTRYTYDAKGNPATMTDPLGRTTTYEHDAMNRRVRTVHPDGTDHRVAYDSRDRKASETDAEGKTTAFTYDAVGQLITVTDATGQVTRFGYDELGRPVSQTDALGRITRLAYDRRGRLIQRTLPTGEPESWEYDAAGNVLRHTDLAGRTRTNTYDMSNRLITREDSDGASVSFSYTATGLRRSYTDARGTTQYSYDTRNRLTGLAYPDGRRLTYSYDARGLRTALTAHVGGSERITSYAYDTRGSMVKVTDPQGREYSQTFDAGGQRTQRVLANGIVTRYGYDTLGRLKSLVSERAADVLQSYAYTLGSTGHRVRIDEAGGTATTYDYDLLDRLTRESVTGAPQSTFEETFTYDAVGNRLQRTRASAAGTQAWSYTYDSRDRLLTDGASTYTWGEDGQLASTAGADNVAYVWDVDDRLRKVTLPDGTVIEHEYDPDGVRVRTRYAPPTGPPSVTDYLVDPSSRLSHVVAETDAAGALKAHYVRAGDELLSVIRPEGSRFYIADGLGSVRHLTDESGAVTDSYRYDAFGTLLGHQGTDANPYLFAGEPLETLSGLTYLRARWLDTGTGRFLSIDPVAGVNELPSTLHRYSYALQDPVNKVDPTGEFFSFSFSGFNFSFLIHANAWAMRGGAAAGTLNAVRLQLARINIAPYSTLMRQWAGKLKPQDLQIHHLIEQRIWLRSPALQRLWPNVNDIPSVVLKRADHQVFTNAWRTWFPYSNQANYNAAPTVEQIMRAAQQIYRNDPQMLRAIFIELL
ncbi:PKD domain-containing protein [Archangium lansingense]|uniref:PKD domain-containing protein n=1 Tax=Archangium lansingense TaxID=2995310 RepID=UPI003B7A8461